MEALKEPFGEVDELSTGLSTRFTLLLFPGVPLQTISDLHKAGSLLVVITILGLLAKTVKKQGVADTEVRHGVDFLVTGPVLEITSQSDSLIGQSFMILETHDVAKVLSSFLLGKECSVRVVGFSGIDLLEFGNNFTEVETSLLLQLVASLPGLFQGDGPEVNILKLIKLVFGIVQHLIEFLLLLVEFFVKVVQRVGEVSLNLIH